MDIRRIRPEDDAAVAAIIRAVMTEHGASGPGFAIHDPEVDHMSAAYPPPRAGYFVVVEEGEVLGGAGFAQLVNGPEGVCELRKMYFRPSLRGRGLGRQLLERVLAEAAKAGFHTCYLETLNTMQRARKLYEAAGFERLPGPMGGTGHFSCDAWYTRSLRRADEMRAYALEVLGTTDELDPGVVAAGAELLAGEPTSGDEDPR